MDFDAAVDALTNANDSAPADVDTGASADVAESQAVDTGVTTPDSFTNVDVNSLPADLQQVYKSMQADYTRKTQEIAPLRKIADEYGGFDSVQQGLEFLKAVQTDADAALAFHGELTKALTDAGLTPAQAAAVADQEVASRQAEDETDFGIDDPRDQQIQELLDWKNQQEQAQQLAALESQITRSELAIRQAHPDYTDSDIGDIYALSYSYGGDLMKANEAFTQMKQRWASAFVDTKGSVPGSVTTPGAGGEAQIPDEALTDFDSAHQAAKRLWLASFDA